MESKTTTNRKGFLKRTGLAIASVLTLSSTSASGAGNARREGGKALSGNASAADGPGTPSGPFARVRAAKGAVARPTDRC